MKYFFIKKSRAQGILEVIIAIYITIIGILSIINLVISNIQVEKFNHNMLIATNLAKEGIEIVRNTRDTNWARVQDWDTNLIVPTKAPIENRTFLIFNNFMSSGSSDISGYELSYFGGKWENCIDDNYTAWNGFPSPCKLRLMSFSNDSENKTMYVNPSLSYGGGSDDYTVSDTGFYRMIEIYNICYKNSGPMENREHIEVLNCSDTKIGMQVISRVGWYESNKMKTTIVEEKIYNWR